MFGNPFGPWRHWIKHTAFVPKGFLRYHVLRLLKERPMSGSEIMKEIEKETGGRWRPSPGSIYPLLAWLQDNGYVKELPAEEGMRRYQLTEQGAKFLEEQTKIRENLEKKMAFFAPPFLGGFGFGLRIPPEHLRELREPARRFVHALIDLNAALKENLTDQSLREVVELLDSTTKRIEELSRKIKGEKTDS